MGVWNKDWVWLSNNKKITIIAPLHLRFLWGLNNIMYVKHLGQCLAQIAFIFLRKKKWKHTHYFLISLLCKSYCFGGFFGCFFGFLFCFYWIAAMIPNFGTDSLFTWTGGVYGFTWLWSFHPQALVYSPTYHKNDSKPLPSNCPGCFYKMA